MTPFEFDGEAEFVHLNARREGPEDQRILASDLTLLATVENDVLIAFHGKLRLMLFEQDGEPRFPKMGAVPWDHAFKGMVVALRRYAHDDPVRFVGVTVKDFTFLATKGGKVEMKFKAQVKPDNGQFEALGRMLIGEEVKVSVHSADGDLFREADETVAAARRLHETAKADGASVTLMSTDGEGNVERQVVVVLGALTDDIREKMKNLGAAEAAKHEDDRDFDGGLDQAYVTLGLSKQFVDEYLTELTAAYTDGWESVPADT